MKLETNQLREAFIILAMLVMARPVAASDLAIMTSGMAKRYCADITQTIATTACVTTMVDAYVIASEILSGTICAPKNLSGGALATLVASYQLRHANEIKDSEPLLLVSLDALKETWPCLPR